VIAGNFLGTDQAGHVVLGAQLVDVHVSQSTGTRIGSAIGVTDNNARNVIAGSVIAGVDLYNSVGTIVAGNFIGVALDGVTPLPNQDGVDIDGGSHNNYIGISPGNVIADNTIDGVNVGGSATLGNMIRSNIMYGNGGAGIFLDILGPTPNSPHTGPNPLFNRPVITSQQNGSLAGVLNAAPNTTYIIDFYASPANLTPYTIQGTLSLGVLAVTTNAAGIARFAYNYTPRPNLPTVVATATDPAGNTSEFSALPSSALLTGFGQPVSFVQGLAASPVVASFADASGASTSLLAAYINWGDGTPTQPATAVVSGSVINRNVGVIDVTGSHVYTQPGTHYIVAVLADPTTGAVANAVSVATISAPLAVQARTVSFKAGVAASVPVASFTDLDPSATAGRFVTFISWGDGSAVQPATAVASGGAFNVVGTHTYAKAGSYYIVAIVVDPTLGAVSQVVSVANVT
jgi:hypothetical protein